MKHRVNSTIHGHKIVRGLWRARNLANIRRSYSKPSESWGLSRIARDARKGRESFTKFPRLYREFQLYHMQWYPVKYIYIYNIRLPTGTRERGGLTFTHVQSSLPQNIIDSNNEKSVSMWILIPSFYIRTLSQVFITEPIWSIERSVNSLPLSFADCSLTKWGTRNCFAGSERVRRVFRSATFGADISP